MPPAQQQRDYTAERDNECLPVVASLIKAIASRDDLILGLKAGVPGEQEKAEEYFQKLYVETIAPILIEANVKFKDLAYIFKCILQPFDLAKDITFASMEQNHDLADAKLYGLKDLDDLRLSDLDRVLKSVDNREEKPKS